MSRLDRQPSQALLTQLTEIEQELKELKVANQTVGTNNVVMRDASSANAYDWNGTLDFTGGKTYEWKVTVTSVNGNYVAAYMVPYIYMDSLSNRYIGDGNGAYKLSWMWAEGSLGPTTQTWYITITGSSGSHLFFLKLFLYATCSVTLTVS